MTLTNYFSAIVYESISPSQMQSEQQTLEHLLFPLPSIITTKFAPSLVVFENGHFQYRNKHSFSDKLFVAYSQDEAVAAWRKWRVVMNEKIEAFYAKRDFKIPPLFADYFQLESVVPVFRPQDTSRGMEHLKKTRFPMYYELNFRISLPTLRPEPFDKAWQDFSAELAAEGKTDVIDFASVFVQNFLESDLRNLIKPFANGILQGEGMKVFMGINKNVIGLDYFHTRLNGKRSNSELYQPYDFPATKDIAPLAQNDLMQPSPQNNTNARTSAPNTLAASAPITHTNVQADMKLSAMVLKRTANNLIAAYWMGLQGGLAACREAVEKIKYEIIEDKKHTIINESPPFEVTDYPDNIYVGFEEGGGTQRIYLIEAERHTPVYSSISMGKKPLNDDVDLQLKRLSYGYLYLRSALKDTKGTGPGSLFAVPSLISTIFRRLDNIKRKKDKPSKVLILSGKSMGTAERKTIGDEDYYILKCLEQYGSIYFDKNDNYRGSGSGAVTFMAHELGHVYELFFHDYYDEFPIAQRKVTVGNTEFPYSAHYLEDIFINYPPMTLEEKNTIKHLNDKFYFVSGDTKDFPFLSDEVDKILISSGFIRLPREEHEEKYPLLEIDKIGEIWAMENFGVYKKKHRDYFEELAHRYDNNVIEYIAVCTQNAFAKALGETMAENYDLVKLPYTYESDGKTIRFYFGTSEAYNWANIIYKPEYIHSEYLMSFLPPKEKSKK